MCAGACVYACACMHLEQSVYQEDRSQSIVLCSLVKSAKDSARPTAYAQAVYTPYPSR